MRKVIELEDRFPTGELTVQYVLGSNGRGGRIFEKRAFDTSAESPARDYLETVTPKAGHSIVLVNALGAFERYDANRNGDSFPAYEVHGKGASSCGHKDCPPVVYVASNEALIKHYKSFEEFGGIYKHHQNKDSKKSMGKVAKAFWNPKMLRVELLLEVDHSKADDLVEKIADFSKDVAVSMGCRVKWDVCSICGHRAPTRKEYCDHARNKLRQVLPDGRLVCVHNPSPSFFDISFVYRPADPTGFMLKKVAQAAHVLRSGAELGEIEDFYESKLAEAQKIGDIQKRLLGKVMTVKDDIAAYGPTAKANAKSKKPLAKDDAKKLASIPMGVFVSSVTKLGEVLGAGEIARLFLKKAGMDAPEWLIDRTVAVQPWILAAFGRDPSLPEKLAHAFNFAPTHVSLKQAHSAALWVEKRGADFGNYMQQSMFSPSENTLPNLPIGPGALWRANEPPRTDVLTMTDPYTGAVYQTTRGAANDAHRADMGRTLAGSAALSAMYLYGLHKHFGSAPPLLKALGAGALGYKTYDFLKSHVAPYRAPKYMTDQGIAVPGGTEFLKAGELSVTAYFDKLALDYVERVGNVDDPIGALHHRIVNHDPFSKIATLLLSGDTDIEKSASLCDMSYSDDVWTRDIDIVDFFHKLGALLLS